MIAMRTESGRNKFGVAYYDVITKIDQLSMEWLETESKRTGLSPESIATAMVRRMCSEKMRVGVTDK